MQHPHDTSAGMAAPPLLALYRDVRARSLDYCAPLALEDYGLQAMPETSPPKWHLAHTTWFFETFLLQPFLPGYAPFNTAFRSLFNSYYNSVGQPFSRARRGLLSRPTLDEVHAWRVTVDRAMARLLTTPHPQHTEIRRRLLIGAHHEMQHQELFFTDIQYSLSCNPLRPAYLPLHHTWLAETAAPPLAWQALPGGVYQIGAEAAQASAFDFAFDNELPRHRTFLEPFEIAARPISNGEWLAFMADGGYHNPELWLADGWAACQAQQWRAPLYWEHSPHTGWQSFTLHGMQPIDPTRPVCHISGYEADAFARWAGARLPTEQEWEIAASQLPPNSEHAQFIDSGHYHPQPVRASQWFGSVWEWTASSYAPYPGYRPPAGALGEYNGKFMCNQLVLRGGSCVSDRRQLRPSYRNFFYPADRWQYSGLRLARSAAPH